ncbi:metal-sulfur cluster assembly factor [Flavihumibacter fluvii]|uniref:metal-sulfur cluster assembly factor n=1 Tax=Flavihumibacter fluvii TaxID=2838157 RepID=UPI001BDE9BEA|nr:metal-sulfur cluster assembly factor [Flavihumibacter fluvii]ULQ51789.1 metal-sulfur cluster assembly factor [Flavihumibacter fluvii]
MNPITNNNLKCNKALEALVNVMDPEIGLNVVDLGLIYQLDFDDSDLKLFCSMTLTTQFCPMGESITNAVKEALQHAFPEYNVEITLVFAPAWNHEMISPKGMTFLNEE